MPLLGCCLFSHHSDWRHVDDAVPHLPATLPAVAPQGLEVAGYGVPVDMLPSSLTAYANSDALLQRVACMSAGDVVLMYKQYLTL